MLYDMTVGEHPRALREWVEECAGRTGLHLPGVHPMDADGTDVFAISVWMNDTSTEYTNRYRTLAPGSREDLITSAYLDTFATQVSDDLWVRDPGDFQPDFDIAHFAHLTPGTQEAGADG